MSTNKLSNLLVILILLLPALLTSTPAPARAVPSPPNTIAHTGISTSPHGSTNGRRITGHVVAPYLTIRPLYKYSGLWGGCTSVYTITNMSSTDAATRHDFYNEDDSPVHYGFNDYIAAEASGVYALADIGSALPVSYTGYAIVASDCPITYTLDVCPGQEGGATELNPGGFITHTFDQEGIYPVTDPTTKKSAQVWVGMGTTSLSPSSSPVVTVTVTENGFTPQVVQVAVGDAVKFINEDNEMHGAIVLKRLPPIFLPLVVRNW